MGNGNNWLGGGDSVRELRSYYHSCHSLVQPYRFCQQSEVFSFLLFWTKWRIRMHSLYVYRFFAQLRMTGQKESKRKSKKMPSFKKKVARSLKKMPSFFLNLKVFWQHPVWAAWLACIFTLATRIFILATWIFALGHTYVRIGQHVRTHRATRTYALVNTYVRIEQHGRTHWPIHIYVSCQAPSYPASRFDSLTSPCFCRCAKLRVETESTKKRMCQNWNGLSLC